MADTIVYYPVSGIGAIYIKGDPGVAGRDGTPLPPNGTPAGKVAVADGLGGVDWTTTAVSAQTATGIAVVQALIFGGGRRG